MSVINSQPLIGASGNQSTAYNLTRSLRFRSSASAYLSRTIGTPTSQNKWTYSKWVKRGALGISGNLLSDTSAGSQVQYLFTSSDTLQFYVENSLNVFVTTQVFRDVSSWYHIVLAVDSAASGADKVKLYVNGSQVTAFSTDGRSSFSQSQINKSGATNTIGNYGAGTNHFDGYMAEVNFVDGQQLTPSSFGETDTATGVWKPKKYTGTYGTNGFYLKFDNLTSTSTLGNDSSGNSNTWTVNNISLTSGSTYDSMKDVPTLTDADTANYSVLNPVSNLGNGTISAGNLDFVSTTAAWRSAASTMFVSSGKWYFEGTVTVFSGGSQSIMLGICNTSFTGFGSYIGESANAWAVQGGTSNTNKWNNNSSTTIGSGETTAVNDVFMVAFDVDAAKVWFGRNGTWYSSGDPAAGTNAAYTNLTGQLAGAISSVDTTSKMAVNFGQRPFAYTPPSGFKALNTFNLPTPTIGATASTQANDYFDVTLYTGNGTTRSITNSGEFQPDWVWIKSRSNALNSGLMDSVRGSSKLLISNATNAEQTLTDELTSFNSNGFSLGASVNGYTNYNNYTYVAWQWKANGAGSSNTAGTITSTVSANTTAGFSIVTYTGNGTTGTQTAGHGLGVAPKLVLVKNRDEAYPFTWYYSFKDGSWDYLFLDSTGTGGNADEAAPTSTIFNLAANSGGLPYLNNNGKKYVAYCFAEVAGYSKFGSYTGNGSTDGTFVFTGFRPKYILRKRTDTTAYWVVFDTTRNTYNVANLDLYPNDSLAEAAGNEMDILSNGFKLRSAGANINASGGTYIYAAFAESPFKYSLAR